MLYVAAVENGCNISICSYENTFGETVEVNEDNLVGKVFDIEEFYVYKHVGATIACCKLYKKECFERYRYPVGKLHEDEFLTYKILFNEKQIAYIEEPLYFYFQNQSGITHTFSERRLVAYDAMEEQIDYFCNNNYLSCAKLVIRNYILGVQRRLEKMDKEKIKDKKMILFFKQRKKKIKKYIELLDINDPSDEWVLMRIRPLRTKLAIYCRSLKNKLKN